MVILLALVGCGPLPKGGEKPDIVLVSIDSLRADHLSSYGYSRPTTPHLDALAARGQRFTHASASSPWTLPSHLTMLSGLWPLDHGVVEDDLALSPDVPLVQQAVRDAGYATAAFVSTLYVSKGYGFSRGFDTFRDHDITEAENLAHAVRVNQIVDEALAWTKENGKGKPVFLFLHIYDVHYPYAPPEPWDAKFDRAGRPDELHYRNYKYYLKHPLTKGRMKHQVAQYDESLAWVDDELGRLVDAWEDSRRPAWWIVTADHGEELGERGSWGHAHTLYPEALHVPLLVAGPDVKPAVRDEDVGTIDVAATIAAMAGTTWGHGPGVDVRGAVPERAFYAETSRFDSARLSVRKEGRRLDLDLAHGARALYDDRADPEEKAPLDDAASADALEREIGAWLGAPWSIGEATATSTATLWVGGTRVTALTGPAKFAVFPPDADVVAGDTTLSAVTGPREAGPLRYSGERHAERVGVDDDTKAKLEALGYQQSEGK